MRRCLASLLAIAMAAGACTSQPAAPTDPPSAQAPSRTPASSPIPTSGVSPSAAPTPAPSATVDPTTTPPASHRVTPSPSPSHSDDHGGTGDSRPPGGLLSAPGVDPVTAYLGSYCYGNACADSPLPPARIIPRLKLPRTADHLGFQLKGIKPFSTWSVAAWPARDERGRRQERLASGGTEDMVVREATFQPPPSGDWVVHIFVRFLGRGDASYFVHVIVP